MPRWLTVVLALALLAGAAWLVERLIVTDEEAVRGSLDRVRRAVLDGDADAVLAEAADDYAFEGLDRAALETYVRSVIGRMPVTSFAWLGRTVTVEDGEAEAVVDVVLHGKGPSGPQSARVSGRVFYARTKDGWKVTGFRVR